MGSMKNYWLKYFQYWIRSFHISENWPNFWKFKNKESHHYGHYGSKTVEWKFENSKTLCTNFKWQKTNGRIMLNMLDTFTFFIHCGILKVCLVLIKYLLEFYILSNLLQIYLTFYYKWEIQSSSWVNMHNYQMRLEIYKFWLRSDTFPFTSNLQFTWDKYFLFFLH